MYVTILITVSKPKYMMSQQKQDGLPIRFISEPSPHPCPNSPASSTTSPTTSLFIALLDAIALHVAITLAFPFMPRLPAAALCRGASAFCPCASACCCVLLRARLICVALCVPLHVPLRVPLHMSLCVSCSLHCSLHRFKLCLLL